MHSGDGETKRVGQTLLVMAGWLPVLAAGAALCMQHLAGGLSSGLLIGVVAAHVLLAVYATVLLLRPKRRGKGDVPADAPGGLLSPLAGIALWVKDENGRYLQAGPEVGQMLGVDADQPLVGRTDADLLPEELAGRLMQHDQRVIASGQAVQQRETIHVGSEQRVLLVRRVPVRDAGGAIRGVSGVMLDHTAESQLLEQLQRQAKQMYEVKEQAQRHARDLATKTRELKIVTKKAEAANNAKSAFLANMSHEIRTPLTAIMGYSEVLADPDEAQAQGERVTTANTIRRNADHLLTLINDILDLSKIEAGHMEMEQVETSWRVVLADVITLMRQRASDKGLMLETECVGSVPETIQSDPTRLRQVLVNLIGNAVKFTQSGGIRIVVSLNDTADEPRLEFQIIDTGIGISRAGIQKLFQPFTQADASTTRRFGGTGLGLTITRNLAQRMGGGVTCESMLGEGSTFTISIATGPLDEVAMVERTSDDREALHRSRFNQDKPLADRRILVAEDGVDNQRLIKMVLTRMGAQVTVVDDGQEALDEALARMNDGLTYDIILMDMQMPRLDGYQATGQLRSRGYTAPIIALTAHAMTGDRDRCITAGCDDYATKPLDRGKLLKTLIKHLDVQSTVPGQSVSVESLSA